MRILHMGMFFILLITMIGSQIYFRVKSIPISVYDAASIFLVMHLLSGISWKAHLVSFAVVYVALLLIRERAQGSRAIAVNSILIYSLLMAFTGKAIIGEVGQRWVGGLGLWTWLMLASFFIFIWAQIRPINKSSIPREILPFSLQSRFSKTS